MKRRDLVKNLAAMAVAIPVISAETAQAQQGTTCCKIDPVLWSSDGQGNITVYKIPSGPGVSLPEGTTTIYAGTSLTESLKAVGDAAYKAKQ